MMKRAADVNTGGKEVDPPVVVLQDMARRVSKDGSLLLIAPEFRELLADLGKTPYLTIFYFFNFTTVTKTCTLYFLDTTI